MYMFLSHVSIIPTPPELPGAFASSAFLMLPCIFSSSHSVGSLSRSYLDMLILRRKLLSTDIISTQLFPYFLCTVKLLAVLNLCSVSYVLLNPPQLIFCPHLFMKLLTKVTNGLYIAISEDFLWCIYLIFGHHYNFLLLFSWTIFFAVSGRQSACDFLSLLLPCFSFQHLF